MEEPYEVYARTAKQDAVTYVGMVRAVDRQDAEVFAYLTFDEERWAEMFVAPRSAVIAVVTPE